MSTVAIDLTGKVFGRLTVVRRVFRTGSRNALWECACVCQKAVVANSRSLRTGHTTSCGCMRITATRANQVASVIKLVTSKTDEEMAINRTMTEYQGAAKKRGFLFELNTVEFTTLVRGSCHYCGTAPFSGFAPRSSRRGKVLLNGVDRVNSKKGYVKGNVVSCCKHCNKAKLDRTAEEFLTHCRKVVAHHERHVLSARGVG